MKNILIHCAMEKEAKQIAKKLQLKEEKQNLYKNSNVSLLITGIGKQRTAIEMTKYLENNIKPEIIINIGYAGSTNINVGEWVNISKSYNFEWDIPGEEKYSINNVGNQKLKKLNELIAKNEKAKEMDTIKFLPCYSAECFVTKTNLQGEIIFDMELHSLAIICDIYKIPLLSLKKVSDNLNIKDYYKNLDMKDVMELESSVEYIEEIINTERRV